MSLAHIFFAKAAGQWSGPKRLGEPLKHLQVSPRIVEQIVTTLRDDLKHAASKVNAERSRLEGRLTAVRNRVDAAYSDKLDVKSRWSFGRGR
jgi:hypothetical protein